MRKELGKGKQKGRKEEGKGKREEIREIGVKKKGNYPYFVSLFNLGPYYSKKSQQQKKGRRCT